MAHDGGFAHINHGGEAHVFSHAQFPAKDIVDDVRIDAVDFVEGCAGKGFVENYGGGFG